MLIKVKDPETDKVGEVETTNEELLSSFKKKVFAALHPSHEPSDGFLVNDGIVINEDLIPVPFKAVVVDENVKEGIQCDQSFQYYFQKKKLAEMKTSPKLILEKNDLFVGDSLSFFFSENAENTSHIALPIISTNETSIGATRGGFVVCAPPDSPLNFNITTNTPYALRVVDGDKNINVSNGLEDAIPQLISSPQNYFVSTAQKKISQVSYGDKASDFSVKEGEILKLFVSIYDSVREDARVTRTPVFHDSVHEPTKSPRENGMKVGDEVYFWGLTSKDRREPTVADVGITAISELLVPLVKISVGVQLYLDQEALGSLTCEVNSHDSVAAAVQRIVDLEDFTTILTKHNLSQSHLHFELYTDNDVHCADDETLDDLEIVDGTALRLVLHHHTELDDSAPSEDEELPSSTFSGYTETLKRKKKKAKSPLARDLFTPPTLAASAACLPDPFGGASAWVYESPYCTLAFHVAGGAGAFKQLTGLDPSADHVAGQSNEKVVTFALE
eukprot:GCRY01001124.1.p1 GENE.GCRY01001124.1~~GCRY01001124.1.p1  ORF type:complete len:503 (+),score=136.02 GCRY01001124.1:193-1701(+)